MSEIKGYTKKEFQRMARSYYIWSAKHQTPEFRYDVLFWSPERNGYTTSVTDAGKYSAREAHDVTQGCTNPTGEGLIIMSRAQIAGAIEWGEKHGSSFAIPVKMLNEIFPIRKVAGL